MNTTVAMRPMGKQSLDAMTILIADQDCMRSTYTSTIDRKERHFKFLEGEVFQGLTKGYIPFPFRD
jgi:hypothetical protein